MCIFGVFTIEFGDFANVLYGSGLKGIILVNTIQAEPGDKGGVIAQDMYPVRGDEGGYISP